MKIVNTLYRVSTVGQVIKDDIPMQREACHQYAKEQGWQIGKEYLEKGVSGFKVSADDRDVVQELLKAAENKEFDILLIYKLDRLGRIEFETPLVLKAFLDLGIEVWSTIEGQRRQDDHMDGLMNFLYFWQAAGESKNTSIRVKMRMKQLTEEGVYTGGTVSYGYKLVDNGRTNKKGDVCYDLQIDEREAEMIKTVFNLTVQLSMGSHRVATYLNDKGLKTHNGTKFQCNTINRILKNEIYIGYIVKGEVRSKHLPHLQIIDEATFAQAQEILKKRSKVNDAKNQISAATKSKSLLSGLIFCGHCGGRLVVTNYKDKYIRKKCGTERHIEESRYHCYHKNRKLCECDGKSSYKADVIDGTVHEVIKSIFTKIRIIPDRHAIDKNIKQLMQSNVAEQKKQWHEIEKVRTKLDKLQSEIADALIGESAFEPEQLAESMRILKEKLKRMEEMYYANQANMEDEKNKFASIIPNFEKFKGWASEFEMADLERKKSIANILINSVDVRKDGIAIQFNMDYQQFLGEWENEIIPFNNVKSA